MQDVITIGKRLVPVEQIAFVEPFDPTSNPEFKPEKVFKARIVLLNRDIVLTELAARAGPWRPWFPVEGDHRFRWMTTTCSGRWRPGQQGCGRA